MKDPVGSFAYIVMAGVGYAALIISAIPVQIGVKLHLLDANYWGTERWHRKHDR